jgi:transposase
MALKHYPEEFKADAVALFLSDPSNTYKRIAADLGISRGTLRKWVLEAQRCGTALARPTPMPPPAHQALSSADVHEQENQQLKARIRELEAERDILRKAAKYFAGETRW